MTRTAKKTAEEENTLPVEDNEDDLGVVIEGQDPAAGEVTDPPAEPVKDKKKTDEKKQTPEEEAAELRKQLKEEQQRRADAEAERDEERKRSSSAVTDKIDAEDKKVAARESEIKSKINTAKTNLDSVKAQLKQAKAAGDTDAEVELGDALTNARFQLNAVEWEEKNFETWKKAEYEPWKEKIKTAPPEGEKKSPYTPKERTWIADHPEFDSNKKFARIAKIAAQEAREEGIKQDSRAYFDYIEGALKENGFLGDDGGEPLSEAGKNTRQTSTSTGAAPQKTGSATGVKPGPANAKYPFIPRGFTIPADWVQAAGDQGFEGKDGIMEYANMRLEEETKGAGRQ